MTSSTNQESGKGSIKSPPTKSTGIISDIRYFFFTNPKIKTLIKFNSQEERQRYNESILQRIGIGVDKYKLLNIHRIGIEAPASYLFDELMKWDGDSQCWPNHIARVNLQDDHLEQIHISLLGRRRNPGEVYRGIFPFRFPQLFVLKAIRIQSIPAPNDTDNARYFLYTSSGGYPIGYFSIYVRTSIAERGELEMSQLFFMVSFNFFGKESWSKINLLNKIWEGIHNRVTANVANRFKQLCEWRFEQLINPSDQ